MTCTGIQFASAIWRARFWLTGIVVLVTVIAAKQVAGLSVSNSLEIWYPEDDPELLRYLEFQENYGSDEIVVVAVSSRDGTDFRSDDGGYLIGDLTDSLLDIDNVATVTSLVTVPESLANVRGRLLSADGNTTALVVQPMTGPEVESRRKQLLFDIRQTAERYTLDVHLGGYGVVFEGLNEASTTGSATLILYAHLFMVALLALNFRRVLPVLLTLVTVGVASLWTMGLYAATGHQLNMVTMVLPTLVLVIGIADCLHILRSVAAQDATLGQDKRVIGGLGAVIGPCFLTTVTTAAGFLGLSASGLPAVQQLGWFGAGGIIAAFLCSMALIPMALGWRAMEPAGRQSLADRTARQLYGIGSRRVRLVIATFLILGVVAGYGISQLSTDTSSIGYLKKTHLVREDSDFIEREFGAYVPVEFVVTADEDILRTDYLDAIWAWQQASLDQADVHWSWSLVSTFDLAPGETPSLVGGEKLARDFERMRSFMPGTIKTMMKGNNELRVSYGAPILSSTGVETLITELVGLADFPAGLKLRPAGYAPLYTRIVDEIVMSQVRGFALAVVLIVILLGIGMRSGGRVLLALPANAIPVALTLGLMGLTGIPLDVASATIASVILGLVVDDTVHLLRPSGGKSISDSLHNAAHTTGGTLVMTTAILACGFLVLGLAEIRSIAWFGVLTSFAVVVAILTDLMLLPALAKLFSPSTAQEPSISKSI